MSTYLIVQIFGGENFGKFLIRNFWQVKLGQILLCHKTLYCFLKIWMVNLAANHQ